MVRVVGLGVTFSSSAVPALLSLCTGGGAALGEGSSTGCDPRGPRVLKDPRTEL